ncbi:epoxyqueuosine reductase QueH [Konateibacter massiliensis]|uniref:epoxyqueuosine reductase QueH n=1 Tax=Konateibacter massiliensis TaxID=2002841 RepID=UPI000C15C062|nr:epoxyqueuosine reductase QueH [Konateibacter massiliensis]
MNTINYQKELDKLIDKLNKEERVPSLLLHSCCAPCSSYVLEYLSQFFKITVFYYNPNIYPQQEYEMRVKEQEKFIKDVPATHEISFVAGEYDTKTFYNMAKGMENEKEGGERCFGCYELRMKQTAQLAKEMGFDYFTTTLSISPLKNSQKLNEIGGKLEGEYEVNYLYSDFKKKNGYKRSVELSKEYEMYRQDYCGCIFSMREREAAKALSASEL